jgi:hypothetical protein
MRLFSEKVSPTFNSSGYNILTVKDFTEVFFDVYEFEINGSKFVAEKTGVLDDAPIISIPVTYQENVSQYDFVLNRGEQSIHFDPNTKSVPTSLPVHSDTELVLSESTITEEQDEVFLEEKRSVIIEEINKAKVAAAQYISNLDKQNKRSLTKYQTEKELALKEDIDKQKQVLFDEFQSFIENLRNDLLESDASSKEILGQIIISELSEASKQLGTKLESIENSVESKLEERATLLLNDVLLSEIERSSKTISENLDSRVASIEQSLNNSLDETKTQIASNITEKLQEITTELNAKDSSIVELNNTLNKQSNKALSRIGTVKTQLEESLSIAVSLLESRIDSASTKLEEYYNNKISAAEDSMTSLSEETKQHVINLIKESKLSLLEEINNIKVTVPNIVIEKSNGNQEIDVPALKTELEKSVSSRFVNEISSLKRLIELSSGGGSVAMQFANGGTMNGNLTIVGAISASQYLGIDIPSGGGGAYLPLSGGTVTGNVSVTNQLSANIISANRVTTLSANIASLSGAAFGSGVTTALSVTANAIGGIVTTNGTATLTNKTLTSPVINDIANSSTAGALTITTNALTDVGVLRLRNNNTGTNTTLHFLDATSNARQMTIGYGNASSASYASSCYILTQDRDLYLSTANATVNATNHVVVKATTGLVGIGTASPTERLTVSGNISASGTIIASNYNPAANVATFLATPTSSNLAAAVSDETGTGSLVFGTSPNFSGTPKINSNWIPQTLYKDGIIPTPQIFDDFHQGGNGASTIGANNWTSSGTGSNGQWTISSSSTTTRAWGMQFFTTGATSGNTRSLTLGPGGGQVATTCVGASFQTCFSLLNVVAGGLVGEVLGAALLRRAVRGVLVGRRRERLMPRSLS